MVTSAMQEKTCNLWIEKAEFRCILASGATNDDGEAILDSPIAKEACGRFAGLALDLGQLLNARGNRVHLIRDGVVGFPVKQFQWGEPDLAVIVRSGHQLVKLVQDAKTLLPRPIGPSDALSWEDVAKALDFLPDNIIIIDHK